MAPEVLPDEVYSPEQLQACLLEVDRLMDRRQLQDIQHKQVASRRRAGEVELSPDLAAVLGSAATALTAKQLDGCQQRMQAWLKQPVTHLTFPAPAPPSTKLAMVRWFREHVSPTALLKFEVNRNIVGGMVVRTEGSIFDFSFRRLLLEHRDRIPELLRHA
jgi:hypothetical protein